MPRAVTSRPKTPKRKHSNRTTPRPKLGIDVPFPMKGSVGVNTMLAIYNRYAAEMRDYQRAQTVVADEDLRCSDIAYFNC